jgi:hypothetical protein
MNAVSKANYKRQEIGLMIPVTNNTDQNGYIYSTHSVGDPDPDPFGSRPFYRIRIPDPDPTLLKVLIINQKR